MKDDSDTVKNSDRRLFLQPGIFESPANPCQHILASIIALHRFTPPHGMRRNVGRRTWFDSIEKGGQVPPGKNN